MKIDKNCVELWWLLPILVFFRDFPPQPLVCSVQTLHNRRGGPGWKREGTCKPMKNILLTIEYDGTEFSGWQRQPGRRTVQGELERVLSVLCKEEVHIEGTSRTDAGVHAYGQRATLRGSFGIPTDRIPVAANHLLAGAGPFGVGDVRISWAQEMEEGFHARFNAVGKTYLYRIRCGFPPDIMERNYAYQLDAPLDVRLMRKAAGFMVGRHDFRAFMASGGQEMKSTVRTIYGLSVTETSPRARLAGFGQEENKVPLFSRTVSYTHLPGGQWECGGLGRSQNAHHSRHSPQRVYPGSGPGFLRTDRRF